MCFIEVGQEGSRLVVEVAGGNAVQHAGIAVGHKVIGACVLVVLLVILFNLILFSLWILLIACPVSLSSSLESY